MFDIDDVTRYIAAYEKTPDKFGEYPLAIEYQFSRPVPLALLQKLFNIDPNYPDESIRYLIDGYRIDEEKAKVLQSYVGEKIDLQKYRLKLECCEKYIRDV